jgi:transcriptional regulator with XRE-family HTH domain
MSTKPEFLRKTLSINIKARRKLFDISQEKLAKWTGLSVQTINDIEGCRTWVSDKTIAKIANALQVQVFQLLIPTADIENQSTDSSNLEALSLLSRNIKEYIDIQFDDILRTGKFRA